MMSKLLIYLAFLTLLQCFKYINNLLHIIYHKLVNNANNVTAIAIAPV